MEARIPFPIGFIKNFLLNLNMTQHTGGVYTAHMAKVVDKSFNCIDLEGLKRTIKSAIRSENEVGSLEHDS